MEITLLFISVLMLISHAGVITPKSSRPILPTYNNRNTRTGYVFLFNIETATQEFDVLRITFPKEYGSSTLGILTAPDCEAYNADTNTDFKSCTVSNYVVEVQIDALSNMPRSHIHQVGIRGIMNPSISGGTGMFKLGTYTGPNLIDYADIFDSVGIAVDPSTFMTTPSVILTDTRNKAGDNGTYQFQFKSQSRFLIDTRFYFIFPDTMLVPLTEHQVCKSTQMGTDIQCVNVGSQTVYLKNTLQIAAQTTVLISFARIGNQPVSGDQGNFGIRIVEPRVNTIVEQYLTINGPDTIPNDLLEVYICPDGNANGFCNQFMIFPNFMPPLSLGNKMYYTLAFRLNNSIPLDGAFSVKFPSQITLQEGTCMLLSQLPNLDQTIEDQVTCQVDTSTNMAYFVNLGVVDAYTRVKFKIQGQNAIVPGTTSVYQFKTYYDRLLTRIID